MNMAVFGVVAPCSLIEVCRRFKAMSRPDDGHLWNVGTLLPDYAMQQPRRQTSSHFSNLYHTCRKLTHIYITNPMENNSSSERNSRSARNSPHFVKFDRSKSTFSYPISLRPILILISQLLTNLTSVFSLQNLN
jgi:hypothetical protein